MHRLLPLALAVLAALPASAQEVDSTLQPFAFLLGSWEGPAWRMTPSGTRDALHQTEVVRPGAGGHVLVVEGTGRSVDASGTPGAVVYEALGVISYDPATERHYVDAFTDGRHVRTEVTPTADGLEWGFDAGGRRVRYVVRIDEAGRWVETGHVMLGPDRWVPFVELTVERKADVP
jgi:hypothetical protein